MNDGSESKQPPSAGIFALRAVVCCAIAVAATCLLAWMSVADLTSVWHGIVAHLIHLL